MNRHAHLIEKPPKNYWIRVSVDPEIPRPDQYAGSLFDRIQNGIHVFGVNIMSESTLLALIEGAIHAEKTKPNKTKVRQ